MKSHIELTKLLRCHTLPNQALFLRKASMNLFLKEAQDISEDMMSWRRDFHHHPELGMKEFRTAGVIADFLKELGLEVKTGVGGTGVIGILSGNSSGKTVALRADIDALPMEDKKTVPYASANPGIAHSCGHDANTAILMGAAKALSRHSDLINGNVKFIFQPSEDTTPGGALPMIKDGALENPSVDYFFASHLAPRFPEGTVNVKRDYCSIAGSGFILKMIGKGGHISRPQFVTDPVLMAGMVIMAAQTIVSRRIDPVDPTILGFASVNGGTADNIIPDMVTLTGSIRSLRPEARQELAGILEQTARGVAESIGGRCELELNLHYPSVYNHPVLVDLFKEAAAQAVGADRVVETLYPNMGGEDSSYFQQRVPGAYWWLGTNNAEAGYDHPLHSSLFDFDEKAVMPVGAAVHAQTAVDCLNACPEAPLDIHEEG